MFKKTNIGFAMIMVAVVALLCVVCIPAFAGSVGDRQFVTLGAATGTATWINTKNNATLKVVRVSVEDNSDATNVVTASRIMLDADSNSYTQTVGAVTCSAGAGTQATLANIYLKYGDVLSFASSVSTGGVAIVEYEQQEH